MRKLTNILVTGGAGFIGSNLIRYIFNSTGFKGRIINLDVLTYAGNPYNLNDINGRYGGGRYFFEKADICDRKKVDAILEKYEIDTVIHLAAESHVDRSIVEPESFINTNINGTFTLLEAVRSCWNEFDGNLFHQVSTDEVFGSLGDTGFFNEDSPYKPNNPYSASKSAADHLVRAYHHTYRLPATLSNCSNNYGPYQFPEKLIPLMIENMLGGSPLPVYGDGENIRDWLYVDDHSSALWSIVNEGEAGRTYNIGGENEWTITELVEKLCEITAKQTGEKQEIYSRLITFVKDRPGHDRRYAIDCSRLKTELGWKQSVSFEQGLRQTVEWYLDNRKWVEQVKSGKYRSWIETNYNKR